MTAEGSLRVAIVGYGLAGAVFHAPLVDATPGMDISAIVTSNRERQMSAHTTYPSASILSHVDELWQHADRYDLTVIGTPNRSHVPLGLASVEAGIPVVIDKPLAAHASDARGLITLARRRNVPLTVFQNRRWDGDFLTIRNLLAAGMLGPVIRYESRFERYRPAPRPGAWRESSDPDEGGGLLLDLGSHLIDQATTLFGQPTNVYAEVNARRPGAQVDDDTFVALEFPNGVRAHLWMNAVIRTVGARFHVSGLRGSYEKFGLDPQESALRSGIRPGDEGWGLEPREAWGHLSADIDTIHVDGPVETHPGTYEAFYAQVRDALRSNGRLPVDPEDSLRTLQVIEAARKSAINKEVVSLMQDEKSDL